MYILNDDTQITPSVDYNKLLKHLNTQLHEPTNQNLIKVAKSIKQKKIREKEQCPPSLNHTWTQGLIISFSFIGLKSYP